MSNALIHSFKYTEVENWGLTCCQTHYLILGFDLHTYIHLFLLGDVRQWCPFTQPLRPFKPLKVLIQIFTIDTRGTEVCWIKGTWNILPLRWCMLMAIEVILKL